MKKVLLLVAAIIMFVPIKLLAAPAVIDWELDRSVFVHRVINCEYHLNNMPYLTANGNVVYCIEPGLDLDKGGTMESTENISDTSVTKDITRASLIGYYGYKKFGHDDPKYYMAAQKLIWLEMGASSVVFSTDREGNDIIDISSYTNEILRLMNNHNKTPLFDTSGKYLHGDEISLVDKNNVLSDYEIINTSTNIKINGNTLNMKVSGINTFKLQRKKDNTKNVYYYKSGMQTVASFGYPYDVFKTYSIIPTYGTITIHKLDADTMLNKPHNDNVNLQYATYELYNESDELIDTSYTDENGYLKFSGLSKGNYRIKEILPSTGYNVDKDIKEVVIDKDNIDVVVNSCEKVIKGKLVINKLLYDERQGTAVVEPGIRFNVYDMNNNLITSNKTDKDGNITFELPYGKYIVRQMESPVNVTKVDDFVIDIRNNDEKLEYTLINKVINDEEESTIEVLPRTGKNEYFSYLILILLFLILGYKHEKNSI